MAAVLVPLLAACSSDEASVDDLRQVAADAGDSPGDCPYDLDVSDALGEDATAGDVDVEVSKETEPADDPIEAQQQGGMAPLDAAAGSFVSCDYAVGDGTTTVFVTTAAVGDDAAAFLLLPQLQAEADLSVDDVQSYADEIGDPGSAQVTPGGTVALVVVPVDGDGSAALMVTSDVVSGDDLGDAAETLVEDLVG